MIKILVCSCDKDEDLFLPFHHCIEKYWPDHPEIIYSTETVVNPYYKTICKNYDLQHWTTRVRETVKEIDDDYILLMCSDIFLMKDVDNDKVNNLLDNFSENTLVISLIKSNDINNKYYKENINERTASSRYKTSLMCGIGSKDKLIDVFDGDTDPGSFETANNAKDYQCLVLSNELILDGGFYNSGDLFGVYRGEGVRKTTKFLENEGIKIDYNKRGFYD